MPFLASPWSEDHQMPGLIATYTIDPDGIGAAYFFLDGLEITEREYWTIQFAALDRAINDGAG